VINRNELYGKVVGFEEPAELGEDGQNVDDGDGAKSVSHCAQSLSTGGVAHPYVPAIFKMNLLKNIEDIAGIAGAM